MQEIVPIFRLVRNVSKLGPINGRQIQLMCMASLDFGVRSQVRQICTFVLLYNRALAHAEQVVVVVLCQSRNDLLCFSNFCCCGLFVRRAIEVIGQEVRPTLKFITKVIRSLRLLQIGIVK